MWRVEVMFEADDEVLRAAATQAERAVLAANSWPASEPEVTAVADEAAARSMTLEQLLEDLVTRRLYWSLASPVVPIIRLIGPGVRVERVNHRSAAQCVAGVVDPSAEAKSP